MPAKIVNDDAGLQKKRGASEFFASKLAPTGVIMTQQNLFLGIDCGTQGTKAIVLDATSGKILDMAPVKR